MSSGKRYKFNGSTFKVQTGLSASAKTITAITQANPAQVTSSAHGMLTGAVAYVSSVQGMTQVNGSYYAVDNVATNTWEMADTNSTTYDAFVTGSPANGISQEVTFSTFCELTGVDQQDAAASTIEVSTICSTAKEFEQGLSDSGTLKLDFNWAGNETVQAALKAAKLSGAQTAFQITMPGTGGTVVMIGTVLSESMSASNDGVWTGSASIKLSGTVFVL